MERRSHWLALILLSGTAAIYAPVGGFELVHYDDPHYVTGRPQLVEGFTRANLRWALTNSEGRYWHPFSSFVHLSACSAFGLHPGAHHLVNVALFAVNVLLLFYLLAGVTAAPLLSFIGVAIWAWHPLRVESVAWVTERATLLCGLFCVLTLWAYASYARRPRVTMYVITVALFALAMLSKPTAAALPLALVFFDLWPLGRLQAGWHAGRSKAVGRLLLEKAPLLLVALAVSALTLWLSTRSEGRLRPILSTSDRLLVIPAGYGWYLLKTIWPTGLALHYSWLDAWSHAQALVSLAVVIGITWWVWRIRRASVIAGWCWFLVLLFPMLTGAGLRRSWIADRYGYVPQMLLFVGLLSAFTTDARTLRASAKWALLALLVPLGVLSSLQVQRWRNTETLFAHALAVTRNNHVVHYNFGVALLEQGRSAQAVTQFREAVRIEPRYGDAYVNLGTALQRLGDAPGATAAYEAALAVTPGRRDAAAGLAALREAGPATTKAAAPAGG